MFIQYGFEIGFACAQQTPVITRIDVHPDRAGDVVYSQPFFSPEIRQWTIFTDPFGNVVRRFVAPEGLTTIRGEGLIVDNGDPDPVFAAAAEWPVQDLPPDVLPYLLGSRYCETDVLTPLAWQLFGGLAPGWGRVEAICDYVNRRIAFSYANARNTRTAAEAHEERIGVCRDYAHLAIAFCRSLNIPARYVNGYLGDIGVPVDPAPMDFSAWIEVYLGGRWHTFDARHNRRRIGRIVIARGRDATDVPMIHSFGQHTLQRFFVKTVEVAPKPGIGAQPLIPVSEQPWMISA
jgi:transglutaminase-like putative cysteine protease